MDDYKEESEKFGKALDRIMAEGVNEDSYSEFKETMDSFGEKFDAARKAEVTHCFCGNEIPEEERGEQEISPSMYYFNKRTCSLLCHNLWILGRFDNGGGRPVGKGWWSIIDKLDEDISKLDPNYQIVQVKEKLAGLRYYANFEEPELPNEITYDEVWAIQSAKSNLYYEIQKAEDPEAWFGEGAEPEEVPDWKLKKMKKDYENLKSLLGKLQPIQKLIDDAEALSAVTCEWCGEPGTIDKSGGWLLTLCDGCKTKRAEGKRPWDNVVDS